jgi:microsomal dipeptidase-like Zn-dependent dipeptidase
MMTVHGTRASALMLLATLVTLLPLAPALAGSRQAGCGGVGERACCFVDGEPFPSCDPGNREVLTVGDTCPGGANAGLCILDVHDPDEHVHCGGDGQRACCSTESSPSCDEGHVEIASTGGTCPGSFSGSAGQCVALTACGRPGQRACCNFLSEFAPGRLAACREGAAPLPGCSGNCYCGGSGTGQVAEHTCVEASSPCGGPGQRACCVIEGRPACEAGLEEEEDAWADEFFPGSGDATCSDGITTSRSSGACVKLNAPPGIAEPDAGWSPAPGPRGGPLRGYLDMHVHLMAHLAHGKKVFSGDPAPIGLDGKFTLEAGNFDINWALSASRDLAIHRGGPDSVNDDHGLTRDAIGDGTKDGTRSKYGAPYFTGWPKWTSTTHQQAYYAWLERAWRGGLRMMTLLAVTNEALCKSTRDEADWPTVCEKSMASIDEQIAAARDFEAFIDRIAGHRFPDGKGWFRIVETPAQARQVIAGGRLAVVLGIEVDNLFNCKEKNGNRPDAVCPDMRDADGNLIRNAAGEPIDTVARAVAHYRAQGIRHVFPVHNFDNAFGAAATWQDVIGIGQAVSEQRWWLPRNCGGEGYGFWLNKDGAFDLIEDLGFAPGAIIDPAPEYTDGNAFPDHASCNHYGLNLDPTVLAPDTRGLGTELLKALMANGMLIDVDHMSNRSLEQTLALTRQAPGSEATPYPVVASHVQLFDLHEKEFTGNKGRHERMRTRAQLEAIRDGGGMIAAMLKDDVQDTELRGQKYTIQYHPQVGLSLLDDCRHSSKTWAQALQYAVDVMGAPVAMGSDFNGIAGHLGPRFGSDACGGWEAFPSQERVWERIDQELAGNRLQYPFTLPGLGTFAGQVTGFRTFDYNVDGLAHIGLLPDLVADLAQIGVDDHYVDALLCSAEQYIRVWERTEALAAGQPVPDPDRPWQCASPGSVAAITVDVVTDPPGSTRVLDFTVSGGPTPITETFQLADATAPYTTSDLQAGTYTLAAEPAGSGWSRAITCAGGPFGAGTGYQAGQPITLSSGDAVTCTVTDTLRSTADFCPSSGKLTTASGSGRWPGNAGMDLVVRVDLGESIQDAVDNVADLNGDGYLLVGVQGKATRSAGGFGLQRVVVAGSYPKPFGLVGCSVRLRDPAPADGRPVVDVQASAAAPSLVVAGLYVEGSTAAGYRVAGNGRRIYGAQATGNAAGIEVAGDGNTIELGRYTGNHGPGIAVTGSGNTVDRARAIANGGDGIRVAGNGNRLLKVIAGDNARGNGADGINVAGHGNEVYRSRAHANGGDGVEVSGGTASSPNLIRENLVGDAGKGNGGHGIFVHGDVSSPGGTVEIYKNTVKANALHGIHLDGSATGHDLQRNVSGGRGEDSNGDCEYLVSAGNVNLGRNQADGVVVPGTSGAFPTGCVGTP